MKMRTAIVIFVFVAMTVVGLSLWYMGYPERMRGNRIISRIEEYRQREGHLPDTQERSVMEKLGFELRIDWHPYYEQLDATNYRIIFLEGFDGPYWFYESKTKTWIYGMPPVLQDNPGTNGQNRVTGPNAGGLRELQIRRRWSARVGDRRHLSVSDFRVSKVSSRIFFKQLVYFSAAQKGVRSLRTSKVERDR
jgi:hypothetical protein